MYLYMTYYSTDIFHFVVTVLSFEASTISVNESSGLVQVALNLSNPLSSDVIIEVVDEPGNATGESINMTITIACHVT